MITNKSFSTLAGGVDNWSTRFSAYGAMFVTISVFLLLFMGLAVSGFLSEPPPAFNNLMETVKALAMVCAGYWVGSSNSSQKKDETIATAQTALANSSPLPIVIDETIIEPKKENLI